MGGEGGGLALNQLLVQMDGVDEPPFMRKFFTNRINTFLDAIYFVPAQDRQALPLRLQPPQAARRADLLHRRHERPDRRARPGARPPRAAWAATSGSARRPRTTARDIFDLYIGKVAHDPDLDTERRRDELARMTSGYSPAMIEQVCSMALTYAHSDGAPEFELAPTSSRR